MHVLVLGGTGLISTAITRQLHDAGHDVTVCNRGESEADIPESVSHVRADRFGDDFPRRVSGVDADAVIDMLCFSDHDANLAVDAFAGEVEQYVMTSSVDVYRRPVDASPVAESAPRRPPTSDYGANKVAAEDAVRAAHDRGAFAATILRPWTTYGPHGNGNLCHTFGVDTTYLARLRDGAPVVVHGDGTGLWGPCHRRDVARAFVGAVGNRTAYGETYNITAEAVPTWERYYRVLADAVDAPDPEFVHVPTDVLRDAAPDRTDFLADHGRYSTTFDTTAARRDLGFDQTIPLERGVREVVEYLRARDRIDRGDDGWIDGLIAEWRDGTAGVRSGE
ncbi:NAD-dependent epimerase/dehydratase family protein [Halapricum sp. CBA1109]|uniref:NAD-dependent epimerase/dehydratase family protein n=1 Tax=Halapricum sp. CBA1109 TaxID=2668068 RepID=UPI0012FAB49E|nr:NAD-dependent epimerase/dehydratase family protein [Halapricum sp. CBA1109]MUV90141.1 NAD-dependent epimerase/dehydratase family protein [Halapricum sp. CBA1109]